MTKRRINLTLNYAAFALIAAACATAALGFFLPLKSVSTSQNTPSPFNQVPRAGMPTASATAMASFEPVLARSFRLALGAPSQNDPAAPDPAPAAAEAPPALAVVGTVGDSLAMIRSVDGSVSVLAVGDHMGGAQLVAIRGMQVDFKSNDGPFTLTKAPDPTNDVPGPTATHAPELPASSQQSNNFAHGY
jgi:hypothetical protein